MTKLSYEEWRKKHNVTIADGVIETLKIVHGVDAVEEVEKLMKMKYELYLSGENV